jgi:glycogen debranching enzyme
MKRIFLLKKIKSSENETSGVLMTRFPIPFMSFFFFALFFCLGMPQVHSHSIAPITIGWINEGLSLQEKQAVEKYLKLQHSIKVVKIDLNDLSDTYLKKNNFSQIWWYKDSIEINTSEQRVGSVLKNYIKAGGHLVLSMEAVRFLNVWGIEKNKLDIREDTVKDEGFGRPRGFHGYHDHPIFNKLHGGAYTWKGKADHEARVIGFFGQHLPDTSIAKVIGIGWSYITFHEDQKLVLEYKLGNGSVIGVGAYTYFSKPNFNTGELYTFYTNIFEYLSGNVSTVKAGYWSYASSSVEAIHNKLPVFPLASATSWRLPSLSLELGRQQATKSFVNVSGRRLLVMGKEKGGIDEVWSHPFMAFRDIQAGIQMNGEDSITWLNQITPRIIVSPEMIIRTYSMGADTLQEVITVDFDRPVAVMHFQWSSANFKKLWFRYTSNLREMWPYSDTASPQMHYQWSPELNGTLVSNPHAGSMSILSFSDRPQNHLEGQYGNFNIEGKGEIRGNRTQLQQVSGLYEFDAKLLKGKFNAYLLAGTEGAKEMVQLYQQVMPSLNNLYQSSSAYYKKLLATQTMITSPDRDFNKGYRWAMVRSDQFLQTTPAIGTSMMAGFGTTASGWNGRQKVSGRPGYAWYFGRDGEWSAMALDAMGAFKKVKEVLELFVKFQAVNGKILHELTSSGAVHYDASDATPLFVVLASHYLKYSGDVNFIREIWPSIKKAMDFCYSTDTDKDGLIENTNVGHGWVEGGPLFGTHTEFYLAGCWAAALDGASYLSGKLRFYQLGKQYSRDAKKVKKIIDTDFWSSEKKYFYHGKMKDGSFIEDATVLTAVPVYLNAIIDPQKAWFTTDTLSGSDFSTDWGIRIISDKNPNYNPFAYHAGMVWPLFSGYASLAEYKTGHFSSGFTHLMNNLLDYTSWSLGSVPETLSGATYRPAGVCSLQGWSETMVIQPAIEGMLGFTPDALSSSLSLSPRFPWSWNQVKISQMSVGKNKLNLEVNKSGSSGIYDFSLVSGTFLNLNFSPVFPPETVITSVKADNKNLNFAVEKGSEGVTVRIPALQVRKSLKITVHYREGRGVLPLVNRPLPGDSSIGARIVRQSWEKNSGTIVLEGKSNKRYDFFIYSTVSPTRIENGTIRNEASDKYRISVIIPESESGMARQKVILHF